MDNKRKLLKNGW
ncbi:hypothetical protein ACTFIY_001049 [Dictyostelium cf. discoideum]